MSEIDDLPADQRAALGLLLKQGQSYEQIAGLLGIEADSVRSRAHAALEAVGPDAGRRLPADRRGEIADYLLGQQGVSDREATRDFLAGSASGRAWARSVAGELRPLAGDELPEIPAEAEPAPAPESDSGARPAYEREPEPTRREQLRGGREGDGEGPTYGQLPGEGRPASRLGGALLLGGIAIVLAVVIVLLVSGGDDDGDKGSTVAPTQTTGTSTNARQPEPIAQINLFSPAGGQRTVGLAQVYAQGPQRLVVVAGQGVAPGAYALWLYNSPTSSRLLGFVPQRVGRDGRFATQGQLPADARRFRRLVVTAERVTNGTRRPPARPGRIVLQGDLRLPS